MDLKRKRSDSDFSASSSSLLSSPPKHPFSAQPTPSFAHEVTPLHLSSRTRKRVRDNRPPEDVIHENTVNMLFLAQKRQQQSAGAPALHPDAAPALPPQKSSLHSFWALPSQPSASNARTPIPATSNHALLQETRCGSCDVVLIDASGDAMDLDVDVDVDVSAGGLPDFSCSQCRVQVCHHCAVSNLGLQRRCLACAGRG